MSTRKQKVAIMLVNLGSPDSPKPRDVFRYLTEFLNDPRVIDINWLGRKILVNGIIVPFRHRKSAAIYQKLWTENGSPLIHYGHQVKQLLQDRFLTSEEKEVKTFLAMRYQNPSIESCLVAIKKWNPDKIIVLPLFPQYASASTGSVIDKCMRVMRDLWAFPEVVFINQFWDHPAFIQSVSLRAKQFNLDEYDHVLFSYHGLPERQVDKVYDDRKCTNHSCEEEINDENKLCYKATCYGTTRAVAKAIGLSEDRYTVCFQLKIWLKPELKNCWFSHQHLLQIVWKPR